MPAPGRELATSTGTVFIDDTSPARRVAHAWLKGSATLPFPPDLEPRAMADDQCGMLPNDRVTNGDRNGLISLTTASTASLAIQRRLPPLAGRRLERGGLGLMRQPKNLAARE